MSLKMKKGNVQTTLSQILKSGRPAATYTSGRSMEPLLYEHKTYVILEPVKGILKKGDLPIYQRPDGIYVIHRLIDQGENWYYTRGDNCLRGEKIPKEWVLGIVTEIQRKGKIIHVTDKSYQCYVWYWGKIWPFRKFCYYLREVLYRFRERKDPKLL